MPCISPITVRQAAGNFVTVPCGKCYGCLKKKRSGWLLRLENEHRISTRSLFVTLTYNDENLPRDSLGNLCFNKEHVQKYIKKLRKYGKLRYYIVSEYGGKFGRPHYHCLFFSITSPIEKVVSLWNHGFVHIGDVTSASINYCAAYVITKEHFKFDLDDVRRPFALMSRNPGIGVNYVERNKKYHRDGLKPYAVRQFGEKVALPRYYSEKIYNRVQRDLLAARQRESFIDYDPVLNYKDWKKVNKNGTTSDYFAYRSQLIQHRQEKQFKSLKQNRNVKDF